MALKRTFGGVEVKLPGGDLPYRMQTGQKIEWPHGSGVFAPIYSTKDGRRSSGPYFEVEYAGEKKQEYSLVTDSEGYLFVKDPDSGFVGPYVVCPKTGFLIQSPPKSQASILVEGFMEALRDVR